jgi:PAS domain S-box-containing protein
MLGLCSGMLVWGYTSLFPSFVHSGWIQADLLNMGPWGISWLRPEHLLGLEALDPLSHTVLWSMAFNTGLYVLGSLWAQTSPEQQSHAEEFVGALSHGQMFGRAARREAKVALPAKRDKIEALLKRFFDTDKARNLTRRCLQATSLAGRSSISIIELAELHGEVEKTLAGSLGAAAAHKALTEAGLFTPRESQELSEVYGEIMASLRARPRDLIAKIDFHQEREVLLSRHATELQEKVMQLQDQMVMRMEAERRLRESEERYRTAIESSSDGVAIIRDGHLIYFNRTFAEIFGYSERREILGQSVNFIVHPEEKAKVLEISLQRQAGVQTPSRYDFMGIRKDGSPIYVAVSATTTTYLGATVVLAYLRDVTARRQAEEDIRRLSRRLIAGIEEDRKRLAADLHDEFGQQLTGLHFGVEALLSSLPAEAAQPRAMCAEVMHMIEGLAEGIRQISSDLRPDMLDHLGLIPTLQWYCEEFARRVPGMRVEFSAVGFAVKRRLDPRLEIVLYRIVQEALNNAAKYAQAGLVSVQLINSHPRVILVIKDDGVGFDPAQPRDGRRRGGIGLIGMRERVASVGGTIEIRSQPGKGAMIRAEAPLDQGPAREEA